jgi:hypothetical protein
MASRSMRKPVSKVTREPARHRSCTKAANSDAARVLERPWPERRRWPATVDAANETGRLSPWPVNPTAACRCRSGSHAGHASCEMLSDSTHCWLATSAPDRCRTACLRLRRAYHRRTLVGMHSRTIARQHRVEHDWRARGGPRCRSTIRSANSGADSSDGTCSS